MALVLCLVSACNLSFERKAKDPLLDAGEPDGAPLDVPGSDARVPDSAINASTDGGGHGDGGLSAGDSGLPMRPSAIAEEGKACSPLLARACAAHNDTQTLICQAGVWTPSAECGGDQRCDTRLDTQTTGTCASIAAPCVGASPGAEVCSGASRFECGADLVDAVERPCQEHAICVDGQTVRCECLPGFKAQGGACIDVDECAAGDSPCHPNAKCTNGSGTFACECKDGFHGDGQNACERNALCVAGGTNCAAQASCQNVGGVAYCVCESGYAGDGESCADIDECANHTDSCDRAPNACVNAVGSYSCVCPDGYEGNGQGDAGCSEVNDCASNPCQHGGSCMDLLGDYACTCTPYATGKSCETAVPQCSNPATNCGNGYTCGEQPFAAPSCTDIDECGLNLDNCDSAPDACVNAPAGSFSCVCPSGFSGSGLLDSCVDTNECNGANVCIAAYPCVNLPDGNFYRCEGQFPDWSLVAPPSRFTASAGVVTDALTGLRWQQNQIINATSCADAVCTLAATTCGTDARCTAAEAKAFCEGLVLGGASDWRLPTRMELVSIAVTSRSDPALDLTAFPGATPETVWTKSPLADQNGQVWVVQFSEGSTAPIAPSFEGRARCVR